MHNLLTSRGQMLLFLGCAALLWPMLLCSCSCGSNSKAGLEDISSATQICQPPPSANLTVSQLRNLLQRSTAPAKDLSVEAADAGRTRLVYVDFGANWANTLRLYRDIGEHRHGPWEIFAFEASPFIQPYLEAFGSWLNGFGPKPPLRIPPSGSTIHLQAYAARYGCNGGSWDSMRECMFRKFREPLSRLHTDPELADPILLQDRLAKGHMPLGPHDHDRYVMIPAAAGAKNGTLVLSDVTKEQMIRGGAHSSGPGSSKAEVPLVDVASWMSTSFRPEDYVVVKMDIEGAEFPILEKMEADGIMNVVDVLALECHIFAGNCKELLSKLKAHRHLRLLTEGVGYRGWDSLSTPDVYYPEDPRSSAESALQTD